MIGAPVGIDDEVGGDVAARGLDEDMDALGAARPAGGVADDPARGVACCDRAGTGQSLTWFERDIGDLPGCGIDLIKRALAPRKHLHRIVIALLSGLDPGGGIGGDDARFRCVRFRIATAGGSPGRGRVDRAGRPFGQGRCRRHRKRGEGVVIGDFGRSLSRAGGQRGACEENNENGRQSGHWALSLDQLMAWT